MKLGSVKAMAGGALAAALSCSMMGSHAAAQAAAVTIPKEKPVYVAEPTERVTDRPQGWSHALTVAANLNVASNRDVVGQIEGNSFLFGASLLGGSTYVRDRHELLNTGSLTEAWSRTPTIDAIVKSNDLLDLQSLYNYFVNDYTGPFGRVSLQTSLFTTERHTAEDVTYTRDETLPGQPVETSTTSRFKLSDSFQPFTVSESLGWFVQPLRSEPLNVVGRGGFGGRHTFADGARAISDADDEPTNVVYTVLQDVHQAGAELFAGFDGKQVDGRVLYTAGVTALFPMLNNDDTGRSILELTKVTLAAALGMGVVSWLSINYQLKVVRDLQLVDAVQIQNSLLFSLQYTRATESAVAAQKKADAEQVAREREAQVAELEARVVAAERRAAAAEAAAGSTVEPPAGAAPPVAPTAPPTAPAQPATEVPAGETDKPARVPVPAP